MIMNTNNKYSILWLDDDQEIFDDVDIIEKTFPEISIEPVLFIDDCHKRIGDSSNHYHALIVDANGLMSNFSTGVDPNKAGFIQTIEIAQEKHIPTYVYSGQLDRTSNNGDVYELSRKYGLSEGNYIFKKSDSWRPLFKKITSDLQTNFAIFQAFPEIQDLVYNRELIFSFQDNETSSEIIKSLLLWLKDKKSHAFPDYTKLRRLITDGILKQLHDRFSLLDGEKDILDKLLADGNVTVLEKHMIDLFRRLTNNIVHQGVTDNDYIKEVIANSFIVALIWYHRLLINPPKEYKTNQVGDGSISKYDPNKAKSPNDNLTAKKTKLVERDRNGCYHVGEFLLNADFVEKCNLLGKEVLVVDTIPLGRKYQYTHLAKIEKI